MNPLDGVLFDPALGGLYPMDEDEVNRWLVKWDHDLGPCNRPFRQEGYALMVGSSPVAVAMSASIVNGPVAGYGRGEVVELARLCAGEPWANRLMIRLWREIAAHRWQCWPVQAAVSYCLNSKTGDLYRFDGWRKVKDDCGSSGGGTWGRKRSNGEAVYGKKSLWIYEYASPVAQPSVVASGTQSQPAASHSTVEQEGR